MLTTIYYSLAIAAYSIFLIQFIIAVTGGSDLDMDIAFDGDGVGDLSCGDIFSFKGIILLMQHHTELVMKMHRQILCKAVSRFLCNT